MTISSPSVRRPVSSSSFVVGICGVLAFLLAFIAVRYIVTHVKPDCEIAYLVLMMIIVTALGIFIPDILWNKVHMRLHSKGSRSLNPSWERTLTKFVGFIGSLCFVGLIYWMFPIYRNSYDSYFMMLVVIVPAGVLLAIPYIWWVDSRMEKKEDGLWYMGRLLTLQWRDLDRPLIVQHLLGWLVKGFFLPLMFTFMCYYVSRFAYISFSDLHGFKDYYEYFYDFLYFIDVSICTPAYLFAMRLTDTHIRSTDSTISGWLVALVCYEPFYTLVISPQYLAYGSADRAWGSLFKVNSVMYDAWGVAILALTLIYTLSTVAFGMRFSNLTHRGIITDGPYRWTKHPAYISKNLSWWMISVPFLVYGSYTENLRHALLLLILTSIYFLRAKTEERHMSRDSEYVQYSEWIKENGLIGLFRRHVHLTKRKGTGSAAKNLFIELSKFRGDDDRKRS